LGRACAAGSDDFSCTLAAKILFSSLSCRSRLSQSVSLPGSTATPASLSKDKLDLMYDIGFRVVAVGKTVVEIQGDSFAVRQMDRAALHRLYMPVQRNGEHNGLSQSKASSGDQAFP